MEANTSRLATGEDDASLSFDQAEGDTTIEGAVAGGEDGSDTLRSRQSMMSNASTFRDTFVDEADANSLLHC